MTGDADRKRARIDSGETHDKVDFPDPAAAPLGTDAEAGGPTAAVASSAPRATDAPDTRPTFGPGPSTSDERTRTISGEMKVSLGLGKAVAIAAAAVVLVLVIALAVG